MKMEDIAKLAGVSKAAVSLALNGKQGISAETREKIIQIAEEHGYTHKSRAAADEPNNKSLTFLAIANSGIVLEQYYQQPFFRELIHHIEERCRYYGYSLMFASVEPDRFAEQLKMLSEEKRSDGIILLGTNLSREQMSAIAGEVNLPLVVLDNCYETLPLHFVSINNRLGAYQAGIHLCDSGHRSIGYLASNVRIKNFDDRRIGFETALRDRGLDPGNVRVFSVAPTILSSQESLTRQLTAYMEDKMPLPTAFFCECDYIAISAVKTLQELGLRVPEDLSVVGFDDISEARIVSPELTTVQVAKERMAHQAVDLVIQSVTSSETVTSKVMIDTLLVQRKSTASPSAVLYHETQ
ncbi:LacI family DNA-binding transcriptional regulator [Paenibacillus arenilitoris]|uniref:LacI family DNA-binding transcriptional regulator n=1 Tax=Paenibacillus arenilitoris TaxID=2772299 RepID=A0A927CGF0_9BACL|nr:LacI family DNA-binding transcriptional regulator [Paenibacillus arenilitoris]MBD2867009.1 LacI family DNA-binding transcriptional regulator [Paenibacillus arenilitoris]